MRELASIVCAVAGLKKEDGTVFNSEDLMQWGQRVAEEEPSVQDAFKLLSLTRKK